MKRLDLATIAVVLLLLTGGATADIAGLPYLHIRLFIGQPGPLHPVVGHPWHVRTRSGVLSRPYYLCFPLYHPSEGA